MSYSKDCYSEPEAYKPQQKGRSAAAGNRRKHNVNVPSRILFEKKKKETRTSNLQQFRQRVSRRLVAFRYQMHRYTFSAFERNTLMKIGALALCGYLILGDWSTQNPPLEPVPGEQVAGVVIEEERSIEHLPSKPIPTKIAPKPKPKNDAAPVGPSDLFAKQAHDYIERYHKIAIGEMKKFGIPASISLAQGLIESRAGTSKLAVNNNNHFGIKCFSRNCKKGHCTNFTDDTHKDFFRKFKSPWESWRAHSQLLASGRYSGLKKYGMNYRKWASGLKSIGYATDRNYDEKLIGIIERYNLHQYDQ